MTDIKLIPDQKTLEERFAGKQLLVDNKHGVDILFENATCLTANVINYVDFDTKWNLRQQYKKQHPDTLFYCVDEHTPLALHFRSYFHYFSNGILVHKVLGEQAERYLRQIKNMLTYHGYEIKKIYGPENSLQQRAYTDVMMSIDAKIKSTYVNEAELSIREIPDIEKFVEQCFAKNNILLTATGNFAPECREFLAVFSSGHFYVAEEYKGEMSFKGNIPVYQFMDQNKYLVYFEPIYVPKEYIKALYEKAQSFDWYVPESALKNNTSVISHAEKQKMLTFVNGLFEKSKCLCATNPRAPFNDVMLEVGNDTSPEYKRYALFEDGTLLLSEDKYGRNAESSILLPVLHKCFPQMDFQTHLVPDFYITEILKQLAERQKKASEIYIDLLKRKAKKLEKVYKIKHFEALDLVAKLGGWKNWKSITNLSEQHARHLIVQEQDIAYMARKRDVSWGSANIILILKSMNVQYSCSWETGADNTPNTKTDKGD